MSRRCGRLTHRVTVWLIDRAARRVPESLTPRLREEWLADVACRPSALSRLRFGVGCCWASRVIVEDYPRRVAVAAAALPAAARGSVAAADGSLGYYSLRSGTLFLIVGLHAALFGGLITSLSHPHSLAKSRQSHDAHIANVDNRRLH